MTTKFPAPFVRQPGNYDPVAAANECSVTDFGDSKTVQSDAIDADINVIASRYGLNPPPPPGGYKMPLVGDFSNVGDFRSAVEAIQKAERNFMEIPARIRGQFENDPQQFMDFVLNPENKEELVRMGLAKAPPVPPAVPIGPAPTPPGRANDGPPNPPQPQGPTGGTEPPKGGK